ncbi:hypothetical protein ACFC1T_09155 [Kitasatospora sp. NPDC056076]|uniref:hypothetical protein n=1 Tax=Streptomycetaceae TaxID=2062 RepID=UPI0035DF1E31
MLFEPVTTENHTNYVMPKAGGGYEIRLTERGEVLVTTVPGGRFVSMGALWRATPVSYDPVDEGWFHEVYAAFGDDPREYYTGRAWRGSTAERISRMAYDDTFGFELRAKLFPVAEIDPCSCRFYHGENACRGCGTQLGEHGRTEAAAAVETAVYGPYSLAGRRD